MELAQIISFYKKYLLSLFLVSGLFLLLGVGAYFLPQMYIATGSFVVLRDTDPINADFSYEGYYAQLTSQDFSKNLMAFFKNESVLQNVSQTFGIERSSLKRKIRVVKEAPSVSRLEVRYTSAQVAEDVWNALSDRVLNIVEEINQETKGELKVLVIGEGPIVKEAYSNPYVFGFGGFAFGFVLFSIAFGIKEYLR